MRAPDIEAAVPRAHRRRRAAVTKVKVCGITRLEDAELAIELGAWAIGFILWPESKRYVDPAVAARHRPRGAAQGRARRRVRQPAAGRDRRAASTCSASRTCSCTATRARRSARRSPSARARRSSRPCGSATPPTCATLERFHTDFHLLDTPQAGLLRRHRARRGTGAWSRSGARRSRILLAGGLTPENVAEAIAAVAAVGRRRRLAASSPRPGIKDPAKLEAFFAAVDSARTPRHDRRSSTASGPTAASTSPRRSSRRWSSSRRRGSPRATTRPTRPS